MMFGRPQTVFYAVVHILKYQWAKPAFCVKCLVRLNRQPAISPWQYLPDLSVSQIAARTSWNCDMVLTCLLLLSCRGHTYKFEEFLMVWTDELKNREPTTMTVRLQKEVDKYKVRIQ